MRQNESDSPMLPLESKNQPSENKNLFANIKQTSPYRSPQRGKGGDDASGNPNRKNEQMFHSFLSVNHQENYFSQVLKELMKQQGEESLEYEVSQSVGKEAKREWLREGIKYFVKDADRDTEYEKNHKENFGLSREEMGLPRDASLSGSPKLNLLWSALISVSSQQLHTGKAITGKLCRRYIKDRQLYRTFYETSVDQKLPKLRTDKIDEFFESNTDRVDTTHNQFLSFLNSVCGYFFREYKACINVINRVLSIAESGKFRGLSALYEEERGSKSLINLLWQGYVAAIEALVKSSDYIKNSTRKEDPMVKLNLVLSEQWTLLLINYLKLFFRVAACMRCDERDRSFKLINNFYQNMVEKLSEDIAVVERVQLVNSEYGLILGKSITQLFLTLFPFEHFYLDTMRDSANALRYKLKKIEIAYLRPIVELLCRQDWARQVEGLTNLIEGVGEWPAVSYYWKKWLGVLLKNSYSYEYQMSVQLEKKVLMLCKAVVAEEVNEFWDAVKLKNNLRRGGRFSGGSDRSLVDSMIKGEFPQLLPSFYLIEIEHFVSLGCQGGHRQLEFSLVSPILIKMLTSNDRNPVGQVVQLAGPQNIASNVIEQVREALRLGDEEVVGRLTYDSIDRNSGGSIEQPIKLLSRLVSYSLGQLAQLQQMLFQLDRHYGTGLILTLFLVRSLQRIALQGIGRDTSTVKCLRYLFEALTAIFFNKLTRHLLPIALGVAEATKPTPQTFKNILSLCNITHGHSEMIRQGRKLKNAVCDHLACILKYSDCLETYFPSSSSGKTMNQFDYLGFSIKNDEHHKVADFIEQIVNENKNYPAVAWFYILMQVIAGDEITHKELEVVLLCIDKIQVTESCPEAENVKIIKETLNSARIDQSLMRFLAPAQQAAVGRNDMLGLVNQQWESQVQPIFPQDLTKKAGKYRGHHKRLTKVSSLNRKQKIETYMNIQKCVQIIQKIVYYQLQHAQKEQKPAKDFKLNSQIMNGLIGQAPLMHEVKFKIDVKVTQDVDHHPFIGEFQITRREQTKVHFITTPVNLIHTLCSLLCFQQRSGILKAQGQKNLPQMIILTEQEMQISPQIQEEEINIAKQAQGGILSHQSQPSSLGISSLMSILENLVLLGYGSEIFNSLACRSYPKATEPYPSNSPTLMAFIQQLPVILIRNSTSNLERQHLLEFLAVSIGDDRLKEIVVSHLYKFKDAFTSLWKHLGQKNSLPMIMTLLLLLNILLERKSDPDTIAYCKFCLPDPRRCSQILLAQCRRHPFPPALTSSSLYHTFIYQKQLQAFNTAKASLCLLISLLNHFIAQEPEFIAQQLCTWMFKQSHMFLAKIPVVTDGTLLHRLKIKRQNPNLSPDSRPLYHIPTNMHYFFSLFLSSPFSITHNYIYCPRSAYHHSSQEGQQPARTSILYNATSAASDLQQTLSQYYCMSIMNILQRGGGGQYMAQYIREVEDDKDSNRVKGFFQSNNRGGFSRNRQDHDKVFPAAFTNSRNASNGLSTAALFSNHSIFALCTELCRKIEQHIWLQDQQHPQPTQYKPDIPLLLLCQLFYTLRGQIRQDPSLLSSNPYLRFLEGVLNYLGGSGVTFSCRVVEMLMGEIVLLLRETKMTINKRYEMISLCVKTGQKWANKQKVKSGILKLLTVIVSSEVDRFEGGYGEIREGRIQAQCQERQNLLDLIRETMDRYMNSCIPSKPDSLPDKAIFAPFMHLFTISSILDDLTHSHLRRSIAIPLTLPLFHHLQVTIQHPHRLPSSILTPITNSLLTLAILQPDHHSHIHHLIKDSLSQLKDTLANITRIRILEEVQICQGLLGMLVSVGQGKHWQQNQHALNLNQLFVALLTEPLNHQWLNLKPETSSQVALSNTPMVNEEQDLPRNSNRRSHMSVFTMLARIKVYQLLKHYLLFIGLGVNNSSHFDQLCNSTISHCPFTESIWATLSICLLQAGNIITSINELANPTLASSTVNNLSHIIHNPNLSISTKAEFHSVGDLREDIGQTMMCLFQAVKAVVLRWRSYDWKSNQDEQARRLELIEKMVKVFERSQWAEPRDTVKKMAEAVKSLKNI